MREVNRTARILLVKGCQPLQQVHGDENDFSCGKKMSFPERQ
jgi:hypothetical protein